MWQTIAVALGLFSALPVPQPAWKPQNMRWALAAFPLVGLISGAALLGWGWLSARLALPVLARAAGFTVLPVLVTGGIHLDGYADTSDALASCAPPEKKQEILADPHCGAFAVIRLLTYFVATLGAWSVLGSSRPALFCAALGQVLSRALSGFAVAAFPLAKDTGLAHLFAEAADRRRLARILAVLAAGLGAGLALLGGAGGAVCAAAAGAVLLWYHQVAVRQFGGISGDLAGWFLQKCEFWLLAAAAAVTAAGPWLWGGFVR